MQENSGGNWVRAGKAFLTGKRCLGILGARTDVENLGRDNLMYGFDTPALTALSMDSFIFLSFRRV